MERGALEKYLLDKIPLAKAMGVQVVTIGDKGVTLDCALALNSNHLDTAFGGSLSSLLILASYSCLFHLMEGKGHVLLKESTIEFLKPVSEKLSARGIPPAPAAAATFLKTLKRNRRARIYLESHIVLSNGEIACRLKGEFVGQPEISKT